MEGDKGRRNKGKKNGGREEGKLDCLGLLCHLRRRQKRRQDCRKKVKEETIEERKESLYSNLTTSNNFTK